MKILQSGKMGTTKFRTLLSFFLLVCLGDLAAGEGCEFINQLEEPVRSCPNPAMEAYYMIKNVDWYHNYARLCCTDEKQKKQHAKGCHTTECLTRGEDPCSTLPKFKVDGRWYDKYEENMRDECTAKNGKKGVVALCCPPDSSANMLLSIYGAEIHEFPHQIKMFEPANCGATVYNKDWVITAAHCVVDDGVKNDASAFKLALGTNIAGNTGGDNVYEVETVIPHEHYSRLAGQPAYIKEGELAPMYNDIALLKLKKPIDFKTNSNIRALKIAPKNFNPADYADKTIIIGWGTTDALELSEHLQKANLIIRTHEECYNNTYQNSITGEIVQKGGTYPDYEEHSDKLLCIGGIIGDSRYPIAGQGDSGGPAICRDEQGYPVLCGVTSFGRGSDEGCARTKDDEHCAPSMYTSVGYFHDWILNNTKAEQDIGTLLKVPLYGEKVAPGRYQHQVHIESSDGMVCGGTLVTPDTVVTAGHCIIRDDRKGRPSIRIYAGIQDLAKKGTTKPYRIKGGVQMSNTWSRAVEVDKLDEGTYKTIRNGFYVDDIAVFKLDRKVPISPSSLPKLPSRHQPQQGPAVETAFPLDTTHSGHLTRRNFKVLDTGDCQRRLNRLSLLNVNMSQVDTATNFCGVEKYSGGSICEREDGGGLFCKNEKGEDELCGIQTFRTCRTSIPNIFLNVWKYQNFIKALMK